MRRALAETLPEAVAAAACEFITGPQGNSRTVKVKDPSKLKGVSVGDTVEITYTEALALKIEKPADAKTPK